MSAKRKTAEAEPLQLAIVVEGKIIESNFDSFRDYAESQIDAISFDLVTDEDFDRADKDAKGLKAFEDTLTAKKTDFLRQMDEVNALLEKVDALTAHARTKRLDLEKRVKANKEAIRDGIVRDGIAALDAKCREFSEKIAEAIKGKKSLVKMQEAVTEVVDFLNAQTAANRAIFNAAQQEHGEAVAFGENALLVMDQASAKVEMERRIERHRTALREAAQKAEIERLRREAEEKARQERLAEQARIETERVKQQAAQEAATPAPQPAPAPAVAPVVQSAPVVAIQPAGQTAPEEMAAFIETLKASFAPVKAARANLQHPSNIEAAKQFADTLGAAFVKLQSA